MKKLFITFLLFCFYVAQGAHGAMIIQQFTSGGEGGDFTAIDFTDAGWITYSQGTQDITETDANTLTMSSMDNNDEQYSYTDLGAGYFSEDWTIRFKINISSCDNFNYAYFGFVANAVDELADQTGDAVVPLIFHQDSGSYYMRNRIIENGAAADTSSSQAVSLSTDYYITATWDDSAYRLSTVICTGAHGCGTPVATLIVTGTEQNDFRYLYGISNYEQNNNKYMSGVLEDLEYKLSI